LSGESETLTIEAVVTAGVGTVITNTATWDGEDNNPNNNEDSASTTVIRRPIDDDDDDDDIPDNPIPEGPIEEPPVVIPEIQPPLADVPQTGDTTNTPLLALLMIGSLGGLAALTRKKKIEESDNK
jgi:LPXTG-motif cell wall-anchored protein